MVRGLNRVNEMNEVALPHTELLHVFQALLGDGFGAGVEDKDFDGDVAGVVDVFEGFEDGAELHVAEAGAFEVGVVGVAVGEVLGVFADGGGSAFPSVARRSPLSVSDGRRRRETA